MYLLHYLFYHKKHKQQVLFKKFFKYFFNYIIYNIIRFFIFFRPYMRGGYSQFIFNFFLKVPVGQVKKSYDPKFKLTQFIQIKKDLTFLVKSNFLTLIIIYSILLVVIKTSVLKLYNLSSQFIRPIFIQPFTTSRFHSHHLLNMSIPSILDVNCLTDVANSLIRLTSQLINATTTIQTFPTT